MKKLFLLLIISLAFGLNSQGGTSEHFKYNENEVDQTMLRLDELERFVNENEGITYAEVAATNKELVANVSGNTTMNISTDEKNPVLGIPSFLWGCCLSWVGILIVYLVSEDEEQTKKALWGCLAGGAAYVLLYVAYVVIIVSIVGASSPYWYY